MKTLKQLLIPVVSMILLIIINAILDPNFFHIRAVVNSSGYTVLSGSIISVLDGGAELAILAIGMTLVTAVSGGQDISVGAVTAIAGSAILRILTAPSFESTPFWALIIPAFLLGLVAAMISGAFNGVLVAKFKIPPMIATLILYTAGRSIAAWINHNANIDVKQQEYKFFGNFFPNVPVPTPIIIVVICCIITFVVLRFTNLRLYTQSVGINSNASRLNGINPNLMKILCFVILGACVAVAALINTSRIATINYNGIVKDIEMDAILAVAIGGNSLAGGKFNVWASVLGAYVIQLMTTTLYKFKVPSVALPAYKAVVVIILVVITSPFIRQKFDEIRRKAQAKKGVA